MGNLGFQYVHGLLLTAGWQADRAFADVPKKDKNRPAGISSGKDLRDFDLLAFSLPWELDYPRALEVLERAGIEPDREKRRGLPLIIAGGTAVTANPYPVARVFDLVLPGEAEFALPLLLERIAGEPPPAAHGPAFAAWRDKLRSAMEEQRLAFAGGVPRHEYGRLVGELYDGAPDLDQLPVCSGFISPESVFPLTHLIEYNRGCSQGCRFCLTGHLSRRTRFRSTASTLDLARRAKGKADRVGLVGSALSDNPELAATLEALSAEGFSVGLSSLKARSTGPGLVALCAKAGMESLTFGLESGSTALQAEIGKRIPFDELSGLIGEAFGGGISTIRLYLLAGIPGETREHVMETVEYIRRLADMHLSVKGGRGITVSIAPLARKCLTPWERAQPLPVKAIKRHMDLYRRELGGVKRLKLTFDSLRERNVQEYVSQAGVEAFEVLREVARRGSSLGAWTGVLRESGFQVRQ